MGLLAGVVLWSNKEGEITCMEGSDRPQEGITPDKEIREDIPQRREGYHDQIIRVISSMGGVLSSMGGVLAATVVTHGLDNGRNACQLKGHGMTDREAILQMLKEKGPHGILTHGLFEAMITNLAKKGLQRVVVKKSNESVNKALDSTGMSGPQRQLASAIAAGQITAGVSLVCSNHLYINQVFGQWKKPIKYDEVLNIWNRTHKAAWVYNSTYQSIQILLETWGRNHEGNSKRISPSVPLTPLNLYTFSAGFLASSLTNIFNIAWKLQMSDGSLSFKAALLKVVKENKAFAGLLPIAMRAGLAQAVTVAVEDKLRSRDRKEDSQ